MYEKFVAPPHLSPNSLLVPPPANLAKVANVSPISNFSTDREQKSVDEILDAAYRLACWFINLGCKYLGSLNTGDEAGLIWSEISMIEGQINVAWLAAVDGRNEITAPLSLIERWELLHFCLFGQPPLGEQQYAA